MIERLAQLLVVLHSSSRVHRDLKPDNVLYLLGSTQWRLLDRGIAASVGALYFAFVCTSGHLKAHYGSAQVGPMGLWGMRNPSHAQSMNAPLDSCSCRNAVSVLGTLLMKSFTWGYCCLRPSLMFAYNVQVITCGHGARSPMHRPK
jgi:serine/threonine protein kinase